MDEPEEGRGTGGFALVTLLLAIGMLMLYFSASDGDSKQMLYKASNTLQQAYAGYQQLPQTLRETPNQTPTLPAPGGSGAQATPAPQAGTSPATPASRARLSAPVIHSSSSMRELCRQKGFCVALTPALLPNSQ